MGRLIEDGYTVVRDFISQEAVCLLQKECDLLNKDPNKTIQNGCILQPILPSSIHLTSLEQYSNYRATNSAHKNNILAHEVVEAIFQCKCKLDCKLI